MTAARPRILFVTEGTSLAHVARPYALASTLDRARYDVHFAAPPGSRPDLVLEGSNLQRWTLRTPPGPGPLFGRVAPATQLWSRADIEHAVRVDRELFATVRPDLVIADLRPSLSISASLDRVPSAMITNAIWTDDLSTPVAQPVPESVLSRPHLPVVTQAAFALAEPTIRWLATRPLNAVRRRHGLRALGARYSALFEADHLLLVDHPALFRLRRRPRNHHFVGPALWSPVGSLPGWWSGLGDDLPLVYVGLGSTGRASLVPRILEGLRSVECRIAIATGGRPLALALPPNAFAASYLPGDIVARRASLVIANGGSPGLYQAWNEGTPVLAIPRNVEQHRTVAAVAWRGASPSIRSDQVSAARVARAVRRMLDEPSFTLAAAGIAAEFAELRVAHTFPTFVDSVLARP